MYVGTWGWSGSAKTNGATGGILLSHSQITPSVLQTTTFPTWTMVNTNNTPWNVTNLPAFNENLLYEDINPAICRNNHTCLSSGIWPDELHGHKSDGLSTATGRGK
jgi:hypothetical protein